MKRAVFFAWKGIWPHRLNDLPAQNIYDIPKTFQI